MNLPDDSLFSGEDYQRLKQVAEDDLDLLTALDESDGLDARTLSNRVNRPHEEVSAAIRELRRVALVTTREDPSRNPSQYHIVSELGESIVHLGVEEGVERLKMGEYEIASGYDR